MRKWSDLTREEKEKAIKLYPKMTASQVAAKINADAKAIASSLSRGKRKADHGGKRKGSGNKPGTKFCQCGKKLTDNHKCKFTK